MPPAREQMARSSANRPFALKSGIPQPALIRLTPPKLGGELLRHPRKVVLAYKG